MGIKNNCDKFWGIKKDEKAGLAFGIRMFTGVISILFIFISFLWAIVDDYLANIWNIAKEIDLYYWLVFGVFLFCAGIFGVIVFKNLIKMLFSAGLIFISAAVNFIAYTIQAENIVLFGMAFSAVVVIAGVLVGVIGMILIKDVYKYKKSLNVDKMSVLKG